MFQNLISSTREASLSLASASSAFKEAMTLSDSAAWARRSSLRSETCLASASFRETRDAICPCMLSSSSRMASKSVVVCVRILSYRGGKNRI